MCQTIEIPSREHGRRLIFDDKQGDYFTVRIEGGNPTAAVRVWGYTDCSFLVDLFASLALDWRGWTGTREWSSIEGEFRIAASTSRTGVVRLNIELWNSNEPWEVKVPIIVEAGQLERISKQVASFFG